MSWLIKGTVHQQTSGVKTQQKLDNVIYTVVYNSHDDCFELHYVQDEFRFPYKIYDLDNKFIKRVIKTYKHTVGNLGVLLNGTKGTGKTVTTKNLCNELNMPVLIITQSDDGLSNFINKINQDVVILIDEYEKVFNGNDSAVQLLSVMDGVLTNGHRRTFLLTTNELYVNNNILQRPGRIRYLKKYKDLELHTIEEILDDLLHYKEHRENIIEYIAHLKLITVDIVKAIVSEVNIHNEIPDDFTDVFNVEKISNLYTILKITDDIPEVWFTGISDNVMQNGGYNEEYIDKNVFINKKTILVKLVHDYDEITLVETNSKGIKRETRVKFQPENTVHRSFSNRYKNVNIAKEHEDPPNYDSDY